MSKDKFKRSNVRSKILKSIIIRVDFKGLTDIMGCANSLKRVMQGKFDKFAPVNNKNYNVEVKTSLSDNQGVNVNLENRTFFQFSECKIGPSKAHFLLGDDFGYIKIDCAETYEGCNEYIKLMANVIYTIKNFDPFISIQRLGLRKIDVAEFPSAEKMKQSVEIPIWDNYKLGNAYVPLRKLYSDLLFQKDVKTIFNIQRVVQLTEGNNFQYTLDIDSYKNGSFICLDDLSTTQRIENMISEQMNVPVFNYFIDTFTETYLEQFYER